MTFSFALSLVEDARAIATAMARDALEDPPAGWSLDFNGGVESEIDVGDLVFRATVGDESCEGDRYRMMYITVSRYDGDQLVDGMTVELSDDGKRVLGTTPWFEDAECSFLENLVETAFSSRRRSPTRRR